MVATATSKTCVWRWQERFIDEGIVALTLEAPGHEATHWPVRAMAKAADNAASSVVKICHDHGLTDRWRRFKLSSDKAFAKKLHDFFGLYASPPAHAIVLSLDKNAKIQARSWLDDVEGFFAKLTERRLKMTPSTPSATYRCHQPLHSRTKSGATLRLEGCSRQYHRCRPTRAPNVGINPLAALSAVAE